MLRRSEKIVPALVGEYEDSRLVKLSPSCRRIAGLVSAVEIRALRRAWEKRRLFVNTMRSISYRNRLLLRFENPYARLAVERVPLKR